MSSEVKDCECTVQGAQQAPWFQAEVARLHKILGFLGAERGDIHGWAMIGLLEARQKFDQDYDVAFQYYAVHRVRGEVLNNVHRMSEYGAQREQARCLARTQRTKQLYGAGMEGLDELCQGIVQHGVALLLEEYAAVVSESPDTEYPGVLRRLDQAIGVLDKTARTIIQGHYFSGLRFCDIAEVLQLSKGRVSQIHTGVLRQLAGALGARFR